jgi:hypothetical protein
MIVWMIDRRLTVVGGPEAASRGEVFGFNIGRVLVGGDA